MWANAFGRASNLVSKLSEIVAPMEDDDEQEDTKGNEYGGGMFGMDGFLSGPLEDAAVKPDPISAVLPESPGSTLVDINLDESRSIVPIVQLPKTSDPVIATLQKPITVPTPTSSSSTKKDVDTAATNGTSSASLSSSSANDHALDVNNQRLDEEGEMWNSTIQPPQPRPQVPSSSSSSSITPAPPADLQKKLSSMETENKMLLKQLAHKNALLVSMEATMTAKATATTTANDNDVSSSSSSIQSAVNQPQTDQSQQEIATAAAITELKARIQGLELQLQEGERKHAQVLENFRIEKEEMSQRCDEKEKAWQMQVTESNVRLQECEESAWQARAEASELLHAYESERRGNEVLQVKLGQVEGMLVVLERAELVREKDTVLTVAMGGAVITANTIGLMGSSETATAAAGMETVSLDDSTAATVVGSSNGLVVSDGIEKTHQEKTELVQQVERLSQQVKDLEAALTQSKGEIEQSRLQVTPLTTVS